MAEAEQNFVGNDVEQNFSLQESDQHQLSVSEYEQENIAGNVSGEYVFVEHESENQDLVGNEQSFAGSDPADNYVLPEQNYVQNETELTLDKDQDNNQVLNGNEANQDFVENEATETKSAPDNSHQRKEEHDNNLTGGGEKKWPGWPGESVFRMLVPAQKVGNIIGRKGEYIKKMVEETKARIKILDGPPGSQERAVLGIF